MKIAVCPGSFDPITMGHLDIIRRSSKLFDEVIVLVVVNPDKTPSFSVEERVELIRSVTAKIPNVRVDSFCGLLADYLRQVGACAIVKGLRAVSDFEYEFQMALTNHKLNPYAETVFLNTTAENMYLSSSMVKQIARFGGDISSFIPREIYAQVRDRLCKNPLGGTDK
ncbi:MAG: pantetheine-phosphate adenylyltransferase [Ruminococcaceae bacterium]|nr:pantetheine-phosphate adenylyltransferase [Oscillospiraceae bacterium]